MPLAILIFGTLFSQNTSDTREHLRRCLRRRPDLELAAQFVVAQGENGVATGNRANPRQAGTCVRLPLLLCTINTVFCGGLGVRENLLRRQRRVRTPTDDRHGRAIYTGEHLFVAPLAILVLLSVMILIPGALLYHVYHSRRKRDFSLQLRASDVDRWFKEIDQDSSGFLDETEMKYLLECMGEATDKHTLKKVMLEMDPDNSGHVSKRQFEDTQCLLHVRNIGPARCKTEELLAQIFGRFGNVAFSTIRDRVDATNGQDTSWAVVQMADASSAGKALTVASESGGIVGLDGVTRLNVTQFSNSTANASTGGMRGMIGGQVSKSQFETWYHDQLTHLIGTPFDVLFCTTNSNAYWW